MRNLWITAILVCCFNIFGANAPVSVNTPQGAGTVLAGPISGGNDIPSFKSLTDTLSGKIMNDMINASAAIAGTKIDPNFGSQNVVTTGDVSGTTVTGDGAALT